MPLTVEVDVVLEVLAASQLERVVPAVPGKYEQYFLSLSAMVMLGVAQEYDSAAHSRVEENNAMVALFATAVANLPPGEFQRRLESLIAQSQKDLRISALNRYNLQLREALIALHSEVEVRLAEPWAQQLNREIWVELLASTERHTFSGLAAMV